jgi:hypothetical protein
MLSCSTPRRIPLQTLDPVGLSCARRAFKEREELEMLRSMTEEERQAWERKNPKSQKADASKQKYKFLQKYYHKGAFFQEASDDKFGTQGSEEIYSRDYTEAVAEENLDKSILPKVSGLEDCHRVVVVVVVEALTFACLLLLLFQAMQLRRGQFGRSGRSKWTHLVAEVSRCFGVSACAIRVQLVRSAHRGRFVVHRTPPLVTTSGTPMMLCSANVRVSPACEVVLIAPAREESFCPLTCAWLGMICRHRQNGG